MRQYIDTLQDVQGNALVGAAVLVQNFIGSGNASIFSDNGLTPILTSTVATGADGQFSFYAADGDYNLVMSKNATVFKTQSPVTMFDGAAQVTFADSGAANAYAVSNSALEKALRTGLRASFLAAHPNSGASTFAYNGLPAKNIVLPGGGSLPGGVILANGIYSIEYDGTNWQLRSTPSASLPTFPITPAETAVSVTPTNFQIPGPGQDSSVNAKRYGFVGDGVADDTAALQKLFTVCQQGYVAWIPFVANAGVGYKITTGLTFSGFGSIIMEGAPQAWINISGIPANTFGMTVTGTLEDFVACVQGGAAAPGAAVKGIKFGINGTGGGNLQRSFIRYASANFCQGAGVQFNDMFDSTINSVSVLSCGSTTDYAVSVNNVTSNTNMSTFGHLQSEKGVGKAVFIDQVLSCNFPLIHAEQAVGDGSNPTHVFGGDSCNYGAAYSSGATNGIINLTGSNTTYNGQRHVGNVVNCTNGNSATYQGNQVNNLACTTLNIPSSNTYAWVFKSAGVSGTTTYNAQGPGQVKFEWSTLGNMAPTSNGSTAIFENCNITGTWTASGNNSADCRSCLLANFPSTLVLTSLDNCTVTAAYATIFAQTILATRCTFNGLITIQSGSVKWKSDRCNFAAGVTIGAGSPGFAFGPNDYISAGAVTGSISASPVGGTWAKGERAYNIQPAVASPKSWVCTVAGTPGTFVSEGNL